VSLAPGVAQALIREIRAAGGATCDAEGRPADPGDRWLFPRHPGRTLILEPSANWEAALTGFVERHRAVVEGSSSEWLAFGAWIHPSGKLYLDIVTGRLCQQEAWRAGEREGRPVAAIYRASTGQTLMLQARL